MAAGSWTWIPGQALVVLIPRGDSFVIPRGDAVVQSGDRVLLAAAQPALPVATAIFEQEEPSRPLETSRSRLNLPPG